MPVKRALPHYTIAKVPQPQTAFVISYMNVLLFACAGHVTAFGRTSPAPAAIADSTVATKAMVSRAVADHRRSCASRNSYGACFRGDSLGVPVMQNEPAHLLTSAPFCCMCFLPFHAIQPRNFQKTLAATRKTKSRPKGWGWHGCASFVLT